MALRSSSSTLRESDQTDEELDQSILPQHGDELAADCLCETCQKLDIEKLFQSEETVQLIYGIGMRANCPFCRLILKTLGTDTEKLSRIHMVRLSWIELGTITSQRMARFSSLRANLGLPKGRKISRLRLTLPLPHPPWTSKVATGIQCLADGPAKGNQSPILQGRRVDPAGPDTGLLLRWLSLCEDGHGTNCSPALIAQEREFTLRVIDTKCHCIVEVPKNCRYVALSYVWGSVKQLQLNKDTYNRLTQHGGLSELSSEIPQTIKDAIILTGQLGERYLWVDAVCIKQDDFEDRDRQIRNMDVIYKGAALTIVSAAGADSNGGLPGVRPGSRSIVQHVERVKGLDLITAQLPFEESVSSTVWETRGWTFQEKILSKRLMIFTVDQVFFHCNIATWFEDTILENQDPTIGIQMAQDTSFFAKPSPELSKFERYASFLHNYSLRNLTKESDALDAFSAIIQSLRSDLGESFLWGLPESIFDAALLWRRKNHAPDLKRKGFPSWSWVAWKSGHCDGSEVEDEYFGKDTRPEIVWFRPNSNGSHTMLQAKNNDELDGPQTVPSASYAELRAKWRLESDRTTMNLISPSTISAHPILHILRFWTSTAYLAVGYQTSGISPVDDRHRFTITAPDGSSMGEIFLNKNWRILRPQKLEFIVVSRNVNPRRHGLNALLIERCYGVAYRVQRPEEPFNEEQWINATPHWKLITLA